MTPRTRRFLRALLAGIFGALIVALATWAHVLWINGDALTLGHDPATPDVPLGALRLFMDTLLPSMALVLPLGIIAMISGPWPLRLLSILLFLAGWYWVAEQIASRFAAHHGTAFFPGEAYGQLFYVPGYTHGAMGLSALAYLLVLSRLNRAPRP